MIFTKEETYAKLSKRLGESLRTRVLARVLALNTGAAMSSQRIAAELGEDVDLVFYALESLRREQLISEVETFRYGLSKLQSSVWVIVLVTLP